MAMRLAFLTVVSAGALPSWYLHHRVHAHTRLPINSPTVGCAETRAPVPCGTWSAAVNGTSPGSAAAPPVPGVSTLATCQDLCCAVAGNATVPACRAVVYSPRDALCHLLDREYDGRFVAGGQALVANAGRGNSSGAPTGNWTCAPVFETAAARFAALGVKAFVRHSKTADEGTWWPSTSDPPEAWHPMVRATNRSLPAEFLARARAAGVHVVLYHYNKVSAYHAQKHPEWQMRWPNGSAIRWARGVGLSPCAAGWVDTYIAQVLQLIDMGADAFYFDEYPGSAGGDWSPACRARFQARYGEPMPEALGKPMPSSGGPLPMAADPRVQELMSDVTKAYFAKLTAAMRSRNPNAVALVSVFRVPQATNGFSASYGGGLYEDTSMVAPPNAVAKTEIEIPTKLSSAPGGGDPFARDVAMSFGYAMVRDAAGGRPAHVWVPKLEDATHTSDGAERALCASAALVAYGAVANPDHTESAIPDAATFGRLYGPGGLAPSLDSTIGGTAWAAMHPVQWAALLWSERARGRYFAAGDAHGAWRDVIYPALGAWRSLVRAGAPATMVNDAQLAACADAAGASELAGATRAIMAPPAAALDNATRASLALYERAGGVVIELAPNGSDAAAGQAPWASEAARPALGAALLARIAAALGAPPTMVRGSLAGSASVDDASAAGELGGAVHAVPFVAQGALHVFVVNNFTECPGGSQRTPLAPPVDNLVLHLNTSSVSAGLDFGGHRQSGAATPVDAVELLSNVSLSLRHSSGGRWSVSLPTLDVISVVRVRFAYM
eukprot:g2201.t1